MNSSRYDVKNVPDGFRTYIGQQFREDDLAAIRYQLYHSSQPGLVRFPGFLSQSQTNHMRGIWTIPGIESRFTGFPGGSESFYVGCPNYIAQREGGNATYFNMNWAPTFDEFTKSLAVSLQIFRNRIEGRSPYEELFGDTGKSMTFRIVSSRNHPEWIEEHRDYFDPDNAINSRLHDLSRLQVTVVLSEKGVDYGGEGFAFKDNSGQWLTLGDDIPAKPGDMFIWRYSNSHRVGDIVSSENQLGFLRMLMPPEDLVRPGTRRHSAIGHRCSVLQAKAGAITYGLKLKIKSILKGRV